MYDVNYDEFEPVESSDGGTYSTARPERKRHVGLAIGTSLLAVVLCGAITLASLFSVRIERRGGSTSVIFTERKTDINVSEAPSTPFPSDLPEPTVELRPQPEGSSPLQQIYEKLQPCLVSVIPDYSTMLEPISADGSACTGVIMSEDGYIITCYHVIAPTGAVKVCLSDGTVSMAAKVGSDPTTDLAVLKIEAEGLSCASFGDSDQLSVGESVLSICLDENQQLGGVMTDGIVCSVARGLEYNDRTFSAMQTNVGTQSSGYGAPIVNMRGEVVGIRVRSVGGLNDSDLSLAVPMANAKSIVDELIENGFLSGQPTLSFKSQALSEQARTYYDLPLGAFVESVDPGGAADRAGISAGDVITGIDGMQVISYEELDSIVKNNYKAGDTVILTVYRASLSREVKEISLELTLDEIRR